MGSKYFVVTDEQKKEYASGYLLDLIINGKNRYPLALEGADRELESVFDYMLSKEYVEIDERNCYVSTRLGWEKLENLKLRYEEYLAHFDLYCAVDLKSREFAFRKIFELDDDEWEEYIDQERFSDLRIAVAWFKQINPADLVFLSFLKEGEFDVDKLNWQKKLVSDKLWEQIERIIAAALQIEDLGYVTEDGIEFSGMQVIEEIITCGAQLSALLHTEEEHMNQEDHILPNDFYDDREDATFITSYESYYDPFYISPIWFDFQ